ncbi:Lrp/AsnC family transcriptional regulator [Gimibacter soli]|uniref:Lrp/AsnC family transcriptional regulator n=1 Tax=Gimibacter soli TaxID=3024400 RepID=A0AAE9XS50_9PROT|nr:Lrp/AsnC family transcriptional regulator [Gimibacter soli]WCL53995.1 Lrp/AsnC family transcriptional regulator [Gimibacter soli]
MPIHLLDDTDRALIDLLRADARLPLSELARRMGVSRSTVQDRLSRLEGRGVIAGYTVRLNEQMTERDVRAHVFLKIVPKAQDEVVAQAKKLKELLSLYTISGEFDLAAILRAETTAALDQALDALGRLKGVERTQSAVILSTKVER